MTDFSFNQTDSSLCLVDILQLHFIFQTQTIVLTINILTKRLLHFLESQTFMIIMYGFATDHLWIWAWNRQIFCLLLKSPIILKM